MTSLAPDRLQRLQPLHTVQLGDDSIVTEHFVAMGSPCSVSILSSGPHVARGPEHELRRAFATAIATVEDLEALWSRFRPDSELSVLNRVGAGTVAHDTFLLIDHAVAAWRWTNGLYDPTVLGVMTASGYDRTFSDMPRSVTSTSPLPKAPGCDGIVLDPDALSVVLPAGTTIDPGGIGKGLAADIVAEVLLGQGCEGVCINIGGDIRAAGKAPEEGWQVGIADPAHPDNQAAAVTLVDHGLATSSRLTRTWTFNGEARHHLIDPRTSKSADGPLGASVIAGQAWWAEVLTKVAMVGGSVAQSMVESLGGQLLVINDSER